MSINSLDKIADLLPEGLDDELLNNIAELVGKKITEEVKAKTEDLAVKVRAFIRGQVESLKEQAIKELELENETFRNAQLFENLKSVFVTELSEDDEINAANLMALEAENISKQKTVLVSELDKQLKENIKLKNMLSVQTKKIARIQESLVQNKKKLVESQDSRDVKLSDTGVVVSVENFQRKGAEIEGLEKKAPASRVGGNNRFLTEEILNLM